MLTNSSGRNVPVEVLGEILGQVVGPIGLHRNRDHFSDSKCHNPWELALVCKNWRDAVFLIPSIELFQAPRLSELVVTSIKTGVFMVYIRDFLRRSRCSIKTLCITDPDLSFLYDVVLDVETLVLPPDTLQYLTPIIEQLTFDQYTNSWLFPKLKKIELNVDITAGPDSEAFVHMLESRLRSPPDLWAWLGCEKIRELELGCLVQEPMRQWFRMKLQEHMVITWKELSV